jgi:hypothetical protein
MATPRGKRQRFALILYWLAICSLLIAGVGRFAPFASGDDYPDFECAPMLDPCDTCDDTDGRYQCMLNLNGWMWGGCTNPFPIGCQQTSSSCGDVYDCNDPPNFIGGNQCNTVFDQCT